ncbi:N-acetylmuramoyl-L-alanine amidase [Lutibacter sp.]|uniref:N-acetylmuramoyl-L-alanine amidase family protein n=1 Tax=Lutibacter sp. TaxID=1925666 RepID=UPI003566F5A4
MNAQLFSKIKVKTNYVSFLVFIVLFVFINQSLTAQNKDFVVVLDAGHGGKDPGKVNHENAKEKEIALNIVLQVGELLEKENGIKVVYTRKTDVFVDLWERGRIANKADANLFVSIHCNAHTSQAKGSETWVLGTHANSRNFEVAKAENSVILLEDNYKVNYKGFDPHSPESVIGLTLMQEEYLDQSIQLASIIQDGFTNKLNRVNRGVKQAGFVVLHQTYMPSVLIETGFITNSEEGSLLNSSAGQKKYAESIFKGILKYKEQLSLNTVSNVNLEISEVKNKNSVKTSSHKESDESSIEAEFKVQIASGSRKVETHPYNFNGLENVERAQVGSSYKYYLGSTSDYSKIKELLQLAKSKGYTSAFIVAFKNGDKVSIEDILKKS